MRCILDGRLVRVVDVCCGFDIEAVVDVGVGVGVGVVGGSEMIEEEDTLIAF